MTMIWYDIQHDYYVKQDKTKRLFSTYFFHQKLDSLILPSLCVSPRNSIALSLSLSLIHPENVNGWPSHKHTYILLGDVSAHMRHGCMECVFMYIMDGCITIITSTCRHSTIFTNFFLLLLVLRYINDQVEPSWCSFVLLSPTHSLSFPLPVQHLHLQQASSFLFNIFLFS